MEEHCGYLALVVYCLIILVLGVKQKFNPLRLMAITLIGSTLLKLLILDCLTFSTMQKVIAYIVLGGLLLVVSFFYQKFKTQVFDE